MEMYKKPVMRIVELEKVDILTLSGQCDHCSFHGSYLDEHLVAHAGDGVHPALDSEQS